MPIFLGKLVIVEIYLSRENFFNKIFFLGFSLHGEIAVETNKLKIL
jgi:hypothetical protein